MPPKATETTTVRKATRQQEGRAVVRTVNTESTQRSGDTVLRKVDSVLKTKSEVPETERNRLAKIASQRAKEPRPLTKELFRHLVATLEEERQSLPSDPTQYNMKAAELYEEIRQGINKASKVVVDPDWKRALKELIDDTKRGRVALTAMQLHGEARQARQKVYWESARNQALAPVSYTHLTLPTIYSV